MKTLKLIKQGCGYLEGYGSHPGTPFLFVVVMGGILSGGFLGGVIMSLLFGIPYLMGAYDRAKLFNNKS